ncbi:MAG: AraC family transcriptional regulator [Clostridia bacterium]|nr:AraC family transcriptional regulator [Clostridia bacterium]NCC43371.1 AraC family transcriptional regulator [Clostridia bacterium]
MFQINYCEYNRSNYDCDLIYRPNGRGDYLFLLLKTPMKCYLNGQLTISRENACLLYTPGTCQHYQAVRKFRNSYMHFSTDLNFEERYDIPVNQLIYPDNHKMIDNILQSIQQEYLSKNLHYEEQLQLLAESLFLQLSRSLKQPVFEDGPVSSSLHQDFQNLRLAMLRSCEEEWTMDRLCKMSNMGKSQFYHYYKLFFASAPKAELIQARMEKARTLLTNEAIQVQQAARLCGFTNVQHFSRYFKEQFHCSPKDYQLKNGYR